MQTTRSRDVIDTTHTCVTVAATDTNTWLLMSSGFASQWAANDLISRGNSRSCYHYDDDVHVLLTTARNKALLRIR